MTDIHARMLAKPAFVVTPIKKNGITHQRMLVMFDGFDEVKPEYAEKVSQWIGKQWHDFPQNYFILTSRPGGDSVVVMAA